MDHARRSEASGATLLRNPMARHPRLPLVLMGALIGGLLLGRPYSLFRVIFRDTAASNDVGYAVAAFVLQSLGNIVIMVLVFLVLMHATGCRVRRWFAARPERIALVTGAGLLVASSFTLVYWDLRVRGRTGIIRYPMISW